jgi:hypothetical protein
MGKPIPKKTVWVLTTEHNDYDQHGEYFVAVFETKPTVKELAAFFTTNKGVAVPGYHQDPVSVLNFLLHLLDGGGRQAIEDQWYNLNEVEFGKKP